MFVISKKSVIKKQEKSDLIEAGTTKICNKHSNPTTYPSEYDKCPACAKEKLTRLILNFNG
jgi:hypothetical protein